MAEKRLSGEEQRAKMKEAYKDDLRKRKQFLEDVKEHKRVKTLSDAVIEITSANEKDDTDVWVEKLNEKTVEPRFGNARRTTIVRNIGRFH